MSLKETEFHIKQVQGYIDEVNKEIEAINIQLKEPHAYGIQPETIEGRRKYKWLEQNLHELEMELAFWEKKKQQLEEHKKWIMNQEAFDGGQF